MILCAIPLPNTILEPLTLITNAPGRLLLTTVISVLGTKPIEASLLFNPCPASALTIFTVSPAATVDNGRI
jgi:hypothetical protein